MLHLLDHAPFILSFIILRNANTITPVTKYHSFRFAKWQQNIIPNSIINIIEYYSFRFAKWPQNIIHNHTKQNIIHNIIPFALRSDNKIYFLNIIRYTTDNKISYPDHTKQNIIS